jgi:hypothetical protein
MNLKLPLYAKKMFVNGMVLGGFQHDGINFTIAQSFKKLFVAWVDEPKKGILGDSYFYTIV